ncbi:MAG: hypothetical protein AAGC95_02385 [Pseudomonadota bacterium]
MDLLNPKQALVPSDRLFTPRDDGGKIGVVWIQDDIAFLSLNKAWNAQNAGVIEGESVVAEFAGFSSDGLISARQAVFRKCLGFSRVT